jgi:DHA1 family L-arabinose/isopropyl-beta-D-thiogalactopyranoside export protein-like MFS transporter
MKSRMTRKEMLPLVGMTISAFIFNTSEFMPIGLLTDIAGSFSISESKAGMLITVYSWIVMLLSLPLILLVSKIDFRKLFMGTIALFGICQIMSVLAPSYGVLMASRIGVACTHAIFWSIASPVAIRLVNEEHRSFALSMVVTGTSIATIAGLPLGRLVGQYMGWRVTFLIVGIIAFAELVYMAFVFPKIASGEQFHVKDLPALLKNPVLICLYVQTILFVLGYYTVYSYIEPFMQQVAKLQNNVITIVLLIFGATGLLGSYLFSKLYDRHRFAFIGTVMATLLAWLLLLLPASKSLATMVILCAFWGITAMAFNVTTQSEVIRSVDEKGAAVATAIYSGLFNLGIGGGSWIGGIVCDKGAISYIGFVGAVFAVISVLFFAFVLLRKLRQSVN